MLFSEGIEKFLNKVDLTDEQRQEIVDHFNKYPNKTKLVNWHKKDLSYKDIKQAMETTSKRQKKKGKGWREGVDYIKGKDSKGQYEVIIPLKHEVAKFLGSDRWGGHEGKWCTSGNDRGHWNFYKEEGKILFYLKDVDTDDKYLMAVKDNEIVELADSDNNHVILNKEDFNYLINDNENIEEQWREYIYTLEEKFIKAIENDDIEKVKKYIEKGVDPSDNNNWAIQHASRNGHTEVVKLLLQDDRVDPSAEDNWAIQRASQNGHIEIVKLLLQDDRVDPSVDNNRAIRWASYNGHIKTIKLLLQDDRVDPSADDNYAIQYASKYGHTEVVKLLLQDDRVKNSLSDEELQKYKEETGLNEFKTFSEWKKTIFKECYKIKRNFKYLKETPEAEDIILNTLEMFSATDDFKASAFLTPDGEYVGKGRGKKIASTVLRRLNIKSDSPLTDFMNTTKTVNVEYKNGNVFVYIPKNLSLHDIQINDITDILNHISGDLYVNIIRDEKIIEKKKFEIYEINKLKSYLRSLR